MRKTTRLALIATVALGAAIAVALHGPIRQDPRYHAFADRRTLLGIPNFWNTISNLPFLLAGIAGLRRIRRSDARQPMYPAWLVLFIGVMFVAAGSAWYHLAPDDRRLAWDRLPMALAFMALLSIVVGEWIDPRIARRCLPIFLLAGAASVIHWQIGTARGDGDLRAYAVVQFLPLLVIPLTLMMFPPGAVKPRNVWGAMVFYALAKALELLDVEVLRTTGFVSGHTLKHLASAAGIYCLVLAARDREPPLAEATDLRR